MLNDSKEHNRQDLLESIEKYDADDNVAFVENYEEVLRQLDSKLGK